MPIIVVRYKQYISKCNFEEMLIMKYYMQFNLRGGYEIGDYLKRKQ